MQPLTLRLIYPVLDKISRSTALNQGLSLSVANFKLRIGQIPQALLTRVYSLKRRNYFLIK